MRAIILAAGQALQLDGLHKCLIKDPLSGKRLVDKFIDSFGAPNITMVVGYQAVAIMQEYPWLNYIYNPNWSLTNNSYSLSLALNDGEPSIVLSADLLFEHDLIEHILSGPDNCVITERRENRTLSAVNCVIDDGNRIVETYQGPLKQISDPEAVGIFKISCTKLLSEWKKNCLKHGNLFVGQNLPFSEPATSIYSFDTNKHFLFEINTTLDYQRLIESRAALRC